MKKLYLAAILISFFNISKAQDLVLDHPTFDYSGPASTGLSAQLTVVNQSANTLDVIVSNLNKNLVAGHSTFFCWFVCYDTSTTLSPDSVRLAPGESTNQFYDHVIPMNIPGHDDITYHFWDQNGNSDTLAVTLNYDFSPIGVFEVTSGSAFNFSGPNPANANTTISYYLNGKHDAKLVVSNMLGSKVDEINLNPQQNSLTLSVKNMKPGIYIYTLHVDGQVMSSKKLIVAQH